MKPFIKNLLNAVKYVLFGVSIYSAVLGMYVSGMFFITGKMLSSEADFYNALKIALWIILWVAVFFGLTMQKIIVHRYHTRHDKKNAAASPET